MLSTYVYISQCTCNACYLLCKFNPLHSGSKYAGQASQECMSICESFARRYIICHTAHAHTQTRLHHTQTRTHTKVLFLTPRTPARQLGTCTHTHTPTHPHTHTRAAILIIIEGCKTASNGFSYQFAIRNPSKIL
jgi:hypothetical protein